MVDDLDRALADPQLAQVVRTWRQAPPEPTASVEQRRQARSQASAQLPPGPPLAHVQQLLIPGHGVQHWLPARLYRPHQLPTPLALYLHGGGWVTGGLDSHDRVCRRLAAATALSVLALDYRLAPEHRWPAALDDCLHALSWANEHQGELEGTGPIGVVGDSSGGHLAALTCLRAHQLGLPQPAWQALAYPNIDPTLTLLASQAAHDKAEGWVLRSVDVAWFAAHTFPDQRTRMEANLLAQPLTGLPPAVIVTNEHDPLRPEGAAYAQALRRAGVPVTYREEPGMIHGFLLGHDVASPAAHEAGQRFFADVATLLG